MHSVLSDRPEKKQIVDRDLPCLVVSVIQPVSFTQELEGLSQTLQGETFYKGDNPMGEDDDEDDEKSDSDLSALVYSSGSTSTSSDEEKEDNEVVEDLEEADEFGSGVISSTPMVPPPNVNKPKRVRYV
jgi:hypothetical protein